MNFLGGRKIALNRNIEMQKLIRDNLENILWVNISIHLKKQ